MADKPGSFWSTTSGVVTGVAGTLTGAVGIATLAAQMGWIGGGDGTEAPSSEQASPSSTTVATGTDDPASRSSGPAASRGARSEPSFTVDPSGLTFDTLGRRSGTVVVRNTGTVDVDIDDVGLDGEDRASFTVSADACTRAALAPGRSCDVDVTFRPGGAGRSQATLVVEVQGAPAREVDLAGNAIL